VVEDRARVDGRTRERGNQMTPKEHLECLMETLRLKTARYYGYVATHQELDSIKEAIERVVEEERKP